MVMHQRNYQQCMRLGPMLCSVTFTATEEQYANSSRSGAENSVTEDRPRAVQAQRPLVCTEIRIKGIRLRPGLSPHENSLRETTQH